MAENLVKYFTKGGNEQFLISQILVKNFLGYPGLFYLHHNFQIGFLSLSLYIYIIYI